MIAVRLTLVALAAVVDFAVAPLLNAGGARPSLMVAVVALWAGGRQPADTVAVALTGGLAAGLLGNGILGLELLALTPLVLAGVLGDQEDLRGRFSRTMALALGGGAGYTLLMMVLTALADRTAPPLLPVLRIAAFSGVITLMLTMVLYRPLLPLASVERNRRNAYR